MEIDGSFGKETLSHEVASFDDNLAVADSPYVEEGRREAEGQVRAAGSSVQIETALVLDDECAVTLCHEAEGNLIHFLNEVFIDETYSLTDSYFIERRETFEIGIFSVCDNISRRCVVFKEVAKSVVDGTSLVPAVCVVVFHAVELESIPLAGLDGIGCGKEVGSTVLDGFGVSIHLSLCVGTALEVCCSFLDGLGKRADVAVFAPEARVLANSHELGNILVCFDGSSQGAGVNQQCLEGIDGSSQSVVFSHVCHVVHVHFLSSSEGSLHGSSSLAHLTPLCVAVDGQAIELELGEVAVATVVGCAVDIEAEVLVAFSEIKGIGVNRLAL